MNLQMRVIMLVLPLALSANVGHAAGVPRTTDPKVCEDETLHSFVTTINRACRKGICDPKVLAAVQYIDDQVLFEAFEAKDIRPVRLFYPQGKTDVGDVLDWGTLKRRELTDMLKGIPRKEDAIVFVLGSASASGSVELNQSLSRDRMTSILDFLEHSSSVDCKDPRGGYFGKTLMQLTKETARQLHIPENDFRNDDLILNQSVFVFVYPCAHLIDATP